MWWNVSPKVEESERTGPKMGRRSIVQRSRAKPAGVELLADAAEAVAVAEAERVGNDVEGGSVAEKLAARRPWQPRQLRPRRTTSGRVRTVMRAS